MRTIVLVLLLGCGLLHAQAGTAPWWRWESQADGRLVCSQWSPGEGWKRFAGPYTNAGCREP
ncbi:hypothetical protein IAE35_04395 [Pseudomonas sp. S75]|uniref:hypothetical protein n=1 Tax=unclassified Pseudomonas TaxID=196821 RepID=UPI00190578F9|nr:MULTISPECIES: hypothetical protein [unclassified Pseudomonas]MBJ9975458.1 hypothetical protein [Pseudomonas sp. S30]MBK0152568.1 hypothetical protein [Pseudomonas sp. S75]